MKERVSFWARRVITTGTAAGYYARGEGRIYWI